MLRERYGITDIPDNVISQWENSNLKRLIDEVTMTFENDLFKQLEFLEKQLDVDTAEGIWLNYIGFKIGYPRPVTDQSAVAQFGFEYKDGQDDTSVVGFDQGPLNTIQKHLVDKQSFGDGLYRSFIKMRLVLLLGNMSVPHIQRAVQEVAPNATVEEREPNAIKINLKGADVYTEIEFRRSPVRNWVKPAGVSLSICNIPDGIYLLSNGSDEIYYYSSFSNTYPTSISRIQGGTWEGLGVGNHGIYILNSSPGSSGGGAIRYSSLVTDAGYDHNSTMNGGLGVSVDIGSDIIYFLHGDHIGRFNFWDDIVHPIPSSNRKNIPASGKDQHWTGLSVDNGVIYLLDTDNSRIGRINSWDSTSDSVDDMTFKSLPVNTRSTGSTYDALAVKNGVVYAVDRQSASLKAWRFDSWDHVSSTATKDDDGVQELDLSEQEGSQWCGMDVVGDV